MTNRSCSDIFNLTKTKTQKKFKKEFLPNNHPGDDEKVTRWNLRKRGTVQQKLKFGKKQPEHPIFNSETNDNRCKIKSDRTSEQDNWSDTKPFQTSHFGKQKEGIWKKTHTIQDS